jgi:hypothetical protein
LTGILSNTLQASPTNPREEYMLSKEVWTKTWLQKPVFIVCPWSGNPMQDPERSPAALSRMGNV